MTPACIVLRLKRKGSKENSLQKFFVSHETPAVASTVLRLKRKGSKEKRAYILVDFIICVIGTTADAKETNC